MLAGEGGCSSSSNGPPAVALDQFTAAFGAAYCHRVYDCCQPEDRVVTSAAGNDEATCANEEVQTARANAAFLVSVSGITFDAGAARRCLDVLAGGPCGAVFAPNRGTIMACQDVFVGTGALGAGCEDGRQCASARCYGGACVGPAACSVGSVIDLDGECQPLVGLTGACVVSAQCPPGAACVGGVCKAPSSPGTPCVNVDDCTGACALVLETGAFVCRAGYCTGQ